MIRTIGAEGTDLIAHVGSGCNKWPFRIEYNETTLCWWVYYGRPGEAVGVKCSLWLYLCRVRKVDRGEGDPTFLDIECETIEDVAELIMRELDD